MSKNILSLILVFIFFACASVGYNKEKLNLLHKSIDRESRNTAIYDGLKSRAFFKVVYRSVELRKSYVDAIAEVDSLTEEEKGELLKKELEDEARYFEFCVVLSTTDFKDNDLNHKNSIWRVFLEDQSGSRLYPVEIKEIKADQKVKMLYPGISRFGKFYHIKFEKKDKKDIEGFKLVFSSILGKAVFQY